MNTIFLFGLLLVVVTILLEFNANNGFLNTLFDRVNKLIISYLPAKEPTMLDLQTRADNFPLTIEEITLFREYLTKLSSETSSENSSETSLENSNNNSESNNSMINTVM
jgi:hypothetical protein